MSPVPCGTIPMLLLLADVVISKSAVDDTDPDAPLVDIEPTVNASVVLLYVKPESPPITPPSLNCTCVSLPAAEAAVTVTFSHLDVPVLYFKNWLF